MNKHHIVVVTENQEDRAVLENFLNVYKISIVNTPVDALNFIENFLPDIVIIDFSLEEAGLSLSQKINQDSNEKHIPILFIFEELHEEQITSAIRAGGIDYILKPFNRISIISRIRTHIEYIKKNKELKFLANNDPMTHTLNRRSFFKKSTQLLKLSKEKKENFHLVLLHVATLSEINTEYGHLTGDKILQEFLKRVKNILNKNNTIGRLSGSDFAFILIGKSYTSVSLFIDAIVSQGENIALDPKCPIIIDYAITQNFRKDADIDMLMLDATRKIKTISSARKSRNS